MKYNYTIIIGIPIIMSEEEEEEEEILEEEDEFEEDETTIEDDTEKSFALVNPLLEKNAISNNPRKLIKIVPENERVTSEIIQLPELVEAIGIRCSEIENGSTIFTNVENLTDPILIAKKEFYDRKSPLILQRQLESYEADGITYVLVEEWKVREMTFPSIDREVRQKV